MNNINNVTKQQRLEHFLQSRQKEIYQEVPNPIHDKITYQMIELLHDKYGLGQGRILDVGCGRGYALEIMNKKGFSAEGITLGPDADICRNKGFTIHEMDFSFLDFDDNTFDCIWCRHALEHSIFPFFSLHEFARVLVPDGLLYVEVPAPDTACQHQNNPNHYTVLPKSSWLSLLDRSGFGIQDVLHFDFESPVGADTYWGIICRLGAEHIRD